MTLFISLSLVCALGEKALAVSHRLAEPLMPAGDLSSTQVSHFIPAIIGEVSSVQHQKG